MSETKPQELLRAKASTALARAFDQDPFFRAIMCDFDEYPEERECRMQRYFLYAMEEAFEIGRVEIDPEGLGASVWITEQNQGRLAPFSREKSSFTEDLLGRRGFENYRQIVGFMSELTPKAADRPLWYLSILGVSPSHHGAGIAQAVMAPVMRSADLAGVDSYLETYTDRAEAFYGKLGYQVTCRRTEPVTGRECRILERRL